ncbi:glycoside hydrolase family 43 protein [Niallia taxi]|uniref:glycoside hydrolase family 43 protein n=1 Tax=Niallia taxi TaxID=2499688 RepID=UPI002E1C5A1F|nr:glycoside hydrolase family 43 protein [Niallia taxi]MED4120771.1 glycoside hydrolase family 43 protein [Niallia taxi]
MYRTKVKNPILPGFNPDPNVLKVEETYYIAVSSFEWLPGVRIYQSNDLVNWEHETDILTDQVDLRGNPQNGSIWAPQISYSNGLFYLIYTDVKSTKRPFKDSHNYLITAQSINGPWSKPVYLNSNGFDPSLYHDTDGRKWLLNEIWDYRLTTGNKSAGIVMQEYDGENEALIGPVYKIFDGTELAKTEAPHLYRHGDYYYLITAEGGTGSGHAVTVCRSTEITGPYELDPHYPMLTAKDKPASPLQCSGHGSIVQTSTGHWYMVYLCTRPLQGNAAILGRETAIQEVYWTEDGWLRLVLGGNGPLLETDIITTNKTEQRKHTDFKDDFNDALEKEWNTLRILTDKAWCDLKSRNSYLRMHSGESIQSLFEHHLLAVRQKDFHFIAETKLDYTPKTFNQMAGLLLYLNDNNYLYAYLTYDEEAGRVIRLMKCAEGKFTLTPVCIKMGEGEVKFKVEVNGPVANFYYQTGDSTAWQEIGDAQDVMFLSGGFTGNFVGIAVHDLDKKANSYADFDYFEYYGFDNR